LIQGEKMRTVPVSARGENENRPRFCSRTVPVSVRPPFLFVSVPRYAEQEP
jgi:hypothetical protein